MIYCDEFEKKTDWEGSQFLKNLLNNVSSITEDDELNDLIARCDQMVPSSDQYQLFETELAQNTIFSILNLLSFIKQKKNENIMYILEYAFESPFSYIRKQKNIYPYDALRDDEIILDHKVMKKEISALESDLDKAKK